MTSVSLFASQQSFADSYSEKIDFASSIEETLGHFWALEQNLDDNNANLALVHATHPISELYDLMKPELQAANPQLDTQVRTTLIELKDKANTTVSREQAQKAIDDATNVINIARQTIVGDELSQEPAFKLELMKILLETSTVEYAEAVSDGMIEEMAEFQDGSAFVWRSQQIFATVRDDVDSHIAEEIDEYYEDLWSAYDNKANPSQVDTFTDGIIHEINEELDVENDDKDLLTYVDNIRDLLEQTKQAYGSGDKDLALSLATKAYLDNYEFLEAPLIELGEEDLMEEVEVMLREDLRNMIKNSEPSSQIDAHIDNTLAKMDTIATIVPEFGTIAIMILAISIISIVAVTSKSKISLRI